MEPRVRLERTPSGLQNRSSAKLELPGQIGGCGSSPCCHRQPSATKKLVTRPSVWYRGLGNDAPSQGRGHCVMQPAWFASCVDIHRKCPLPYCSCDKESETLQDNCVSPTNLPTKMS